MDHVYIGDKKFELNNGQTYIMGILNITPDSFSDGSKYNSIDNVLREDCVHEETMDRSITGGNGTCAVCLQR